MNETTAQGTWGLLDVTNYGLAVSTIWVPASYRTGTDEYETCVFPVGRVLDLFVATYPTKEDARAGHARALAAWCNVTDYEDTNEEGQEVNAIAVTPRAIRITTNFDELFDAVDPTVLSTVDCEATVAGYISEVQERLLKAYPTLREVTVSNDLNDHVSVWNDEDSDLDPEVQLAVYESDENVVEEVEWVLAAVYDAGVFWVLREGEEHGA